MNIFTIPVDCALCGGEGVAAPRGGTHPWLHKHYHKDPRVCEENIKAEKARLKKELDEAKKEIAGASKKKILSECGIKG